MQLDYAVQKMTAAVHSMAYSASPIQARLHSALLTIHTLTPEHFPTEELQRAWGTFYKTVTAIDDPKEGSFGATTRQMTDAKASETAQQLVNILSLSEIYLEDHRRR